MRIRPFMPGDGEPLAALYHSAVQEIGARDYSPEQVAVWSPAPLDPAGYAARAAGRLTLVAENAGGEPVGYIDLEPSGRIDHFYCRPDVVGAGVGSALYAALERAAREAGTQRLTVEASEAARRFFLRRGFEIESRNDFELGGVAIHNYRMVKSLTF